VAIYRASITGNSRTADPNGMIERELIAEGTVTPVRTFEDSSQAWQTNWTAAAEILERHKPNLLLFIS
jgi:hypothetical protein